MPRDQATPNGVATTDQHGTTAVPAYLAELLRNAVANDPGLEKIETQRWIEVAADQLGQDTELKKFASRLRSISGDTVPSRHLAMKVREEYERGKGRELAAAVLLAEKVASAPQLFDQLITVSGLADVPPVEAHIREFLYRNTLAEMYGPPGTYKSFIAISMLCALAAGCDWHGHEINDQAASLYIAAEGVSGLRARMLAWCVANDVDPLDIDGWINIIPEAVQLGDPHQIDQIIRIVEERNIGVVVFDTRARCTVGLDENSATEQGRAIAQVDRIRSTTGATVVTVHHSSKGAQTSRGSSAWKGAVWTELAVTTDDGLISLRAQKHKDAPDGHLINLRPKSVVVPTEMMPDVDPFARASLALSVSGSSGTETESLTQSSLTLVSLFRSSVPDNGMSGAQLLALAEPEGVSRSTMYRTLKQLVNAKMVANVGTDKRPMYVLSEEVRTS